MHTLDMIVFSNHVLLIPIVPTMELVVNELWKARIFDDKKSIFVIHTNL